MPYNTILIDNEGDTFGMSNSAVNLSVDRDQSLPFKVEFAVNKDILRPATVKMTGIVDQSLRFEHGFEIR